MTTAIKPVSAATSNAVAIIKPEEQTNYISVWSQGFDKLTKTQGLALTNEQRNFGVSLITGLVMKCAKDETDVNKLDMTNFYEQVKHCAKLQLSFQEGEIYIDTRNNKNTGKIDVTVRKQYQGTQKLAARWCSKKITHWADGVVFDGDTFSYDFDYNTGLYSIKFTPNPNISRNDLSKVRNAFAIAYVYENGRTVPYACVIDKSRIMRAFNASSAKEKGPWSTDTVRMVRKTAYWCLYNDILKPFIDIPADLQDSVSALDDEMDFSPVENIPDNVYDIPTENANDFTAEQDDFQAYLNEMDNKEEPTDVIIENSTVEVNELTCSICGKKISDKVAKYSQDKFGKPLCFDCQKNA